MIPKAAPLLPTATKFHILWNVTISGNLPFNLSNRLNSLLFKIMTGCKYKINFYRWSAHALWSFTWRHYFPKWWNKRGILGCFWLHIMKMQFSKLLPRIERFLQYLSLAICFISVWQVHRWHSFPPSRNCGTFCIQNCSSNVILTYVSSSQSYLLRLSLSCIFVTSENAL